MAVIRRVKSSNIKKNIDITYDLDQAISILQMHGNKKIERTRKLTIKTVDEFLLSGKFNSTLGVDGFNVFKKCLKDILSKINDNSFSSNLINLDKMFEALMASGLYYESDYIPESLQDMYSDNRWLTAYRYIAKNFPEINYKDYRIIVKRFQETRGYSFYIDPSDSNYLKTVPKTKGLFEEIKDLKADLMQLNSKELKKICESIGVKAARSQLDTSNRIIDSNIDITEFLPKKTAERINLRIVDEELAIGNDLINIDKYLRLMAKEVRKDFSEYILSRRQISFIGV